MEDRRQVRDEGQGMELAEDGVWNGCKGIE